MANGVTSKSGSTLKSTIKDQSGAGKTKIGEILSKEGQITSMQLNEALDVQKKTQERLSSILLNKGYIDPDTIINVLGRLYNYDVLPFSKIKPDPAAFKVLLYETAKTDLVFPLKLTGEDLLVTMAEPTDTSVVEALGKNTGKNIQVFVSTENDIIQAYRDFYKISDEEYKSFLHFEDDMDDDEPVTSVGSVAKNISRTKRSFRRKIYAA
ncbi:MAG: hypothetical protein HUN05_13470 [Desulfobacter sp.]|nr:MAG: hypothetical protein HUN05_13470 [Desulfobacter sp.]